MHAIIFHGSRLVTIKNKRGYDIPGGHLEKNETPTTALKREISEEAGALPYTSPLFFAEIVANNNISPYSKKTMLFATCSTKHTPPKGELMTAAEFLDKYEQNDFKEAMEKILRQAQLLVK
ncbi:NUDIX domain-containing protein [Candidatus Woesebacteria bacterium]|nr:NUDIX domain-containing protein [Candidatus Woesebacteria bacterium]MCD8526880.1 NUDIX domain-containing protein [Candidatus Woesebacteria bacterium]MCD8545782.1 NUDIX domain-containing protein [Candidatus Woesebacteria bacterium]